MDKFPLLITGGAGFIGSHLADALLLDGHEVHILDNLSSGNLTNLPKTAVFHQMDLCEKEKIQQLFDTYHYETVFHCAAQVSVIRSVADPVKDTQTNIQGLLNILEAGRKNGLRKVIFSSSGGVIYGNPQQVPQTEDHPLFPTCPYGISKLASEHYLRYYWETYGIGYIALRYANVYGPRQNPESGAGVIAVFLEQIKKKQQPVINGTGSKTRDFIYVDDVVLANLKALNYQGVGSFNIGTNSETNILTIFRLIKKYSNRVIKEVHGPNMAGEQLRSVLDNSLAQEKLGWLPTIDLKMGLKKTVYWYLNN